MRDLIRTLIPGVAVLALMPSTLCGQRPVQPAPATTPDTETERTWSPRGDWRGPSGFDGSGVDRAFLAESDWALTSLIFRERNDDPVAIEFVGRILCRDQECPFQTLRTLRVTSGINGTFYSQRSLDAGDERYATALQVCTSSTGKIKGVRLWPARIKADGSLEAGARQEFRRPNCSDNRWHQKEECGNRQVIVGVRAVGTEQKGFTGLYVRCGRVN